MGELAAALTSDPAYLAMLYPRLFSPEEGGKSLYVPEVVGNLSKCLAQGLNISGVMGRWVHSAGSH